MQRYPAGQHILRQIIWMPCYIHLVHRPIGQKVSAINDGLTEEQAMYLYWTLPLRRGQPFI